MKSKFYKYITGSLLLASCFVGFEACKKYLDIQPVSSFDPEFTFSNVPNTRKAVLGAYYALAGDAGYGIRLSMYYPFDNDEMMGQGATPYPDNERRDLAHYNVQPSNQVLAPPFNQIYTGIEKANLCIYYIPQSPAYTSGSASEKAEMARMLGEALTLRAHFYFDLIKNWGDVPGQFEPAATQSNLFLPKMDRDSIYDRVLKDLAFAETIVPWRSQAGTADERITQGAVRALRARLALFRGGYSLRRNRKMERRSDYLTYYKIARDECDTIMQHPQDHKLNPSYKAVFQDNLLAHRLEPNGEVIWEVAMAGGGSSAGDSRLGQYKGNYIMPSYFYLFDSTDTRRDVTAAPYNISATGVKTVAPAQTILDGKFRRDWMTNPTYLITSASYYAVNFPLIRYSDVLLMYAEADNEINQNPSAKAKAAFEEVRKRGYGGNASLIGITPTDYPGFFNAIVKERSLELGGLEGVRKYDLIRWNLLAQKLAEAKATMAAMAARQAPWNNYPATMYYLKTSTDPVVGGQVVWFNSFFKPSPTPAPSTTLYGSVAWFGSGITSSILTYFAVAFQPNHSELLPISQSIIDANPNLTQDYGY